MLIDSHSHLDDEAFAEDHSAVVARAEAADIGAIIDPGCDLASSRLAVDLSRQYPIVHAAVGFHPENCANTTAADLDAVRALAAAPKVVAIGEIGLDYHWDDNPSRAKQQEVFVAQLELAGELGLPVIIHDRDAHGDALALVRSHFSRDAGGVFHCYSGSVETARALLDLGFYLGFDGPITFKNNKKSPAVVAYAPMDRLLIETDAPYMAPVPLRGRRNEPAFVTHVAAKMAAIKALPLEAVAEATTANAKRLFHL